MWAGNVPLLAQVYVYYKTKKQANKQRSVTKVGIGLSGKWLLGILQKLVAAVTTAGMRGRVIPVAQAVCVVVSCQMEVRPHVVDAHLSLSCATHCLSRNKCTSDKTGPVLCWSPLPTPHSCPPYTAHTMSWHRQGAKGTCVHPSLLKIWGEV